MIRKLVLTYDSDKVSEPILATVVKETGLLLNVLQAKVDSRGGEIIVSVEAEEEQVQRIIELFKSRGVRVQELKQVIRLNKDLCLDCGYCLPVCPTGALRFTSDWKMRLEEEKCVYCKLCVEICPLRALSLEL
jgi:ferredoxin